MGSVSVFFFFFNGTATTEIYTLSLRDALPIYRQVRRMTAAVGHPTLRLVRWAIGSLTLAGLTPGDWRSLTPDEVQQLLAENLPP